MAILSPQQADDLIAALLDAFPMRIQFAQMMFTRIGKPLDAVAVTGFLEGDLFYVIQAAESQGWTYKLIAAARDSRPGNDKLMEFAQQFHLSPVRESRAELELIVNASNDFLDVATWRAELGAAELRICRVEVPRLNGETAYGTGFLIGPSTVITNYHVIEDVLKKNAKPEDIRLRFDYKRLEDGTTLNQGTVYPLVADWLTLFSPYSQADLNPAAHSLPAENELDFALLHAKGTPAKDRAGRVNTDIDSPQRGYFQIPDPPVNLAKGAPLLILQHPEGTYLKLAIDTQSKLETNTNGTRIRYTTNTLPGSSGSPCFNIDWKLVALHHLGDPNYDELLHKAEYNQGIPLGKIREYIQSQGLGGALTG